MLCHDHQCIFVHIPKTAGESVEHVFLDLVGLSWRERAPLLLRRNHDPNVGPPRLAHLTAQEYTDYGYIEREKFDAYFKFSFVRNPWARLVSEYKFRKLYEHYDFKAFLLKHFPQPNQPLAYRHIMPQYDFLFDAEGRRLVDYIGKFENLQQDFDEICQKLNIKQTTLPHINKAPQLKVIPQGFKALLWTLGRLPLHVRSLQNTFDTYHDYYDDETLDFVANYYESDIKAFGYEFG